MFSTKFLHTCQTPWSSTGHTTVRTVLTTSTVLTASQVTYFSVIIVCTWWADGWGNTSCGAVATSGTYASLCVYHCIRLWAYHLYQTVYNVTYVITYALKNHIYQSVCRTLNMYMYSIIIYTALSV
jgi:hypothetical protein